MYCAAHCLMCNRCFALLLGFELQLNCAFVSAALQGMFPKGALFHRGAHAGNAESAWDAKREAWMADWKAKRRMALRQQNSLRSKP